MEIDSEQLRSMNISSLDEEEDEAEVQDNNVDDEISDEDDDEYQVPMTLGFAEKPKTVWSLLRQHFPSKAGGAPAWLDPVNLPSGKACLCDFCGEPLQFLLQVYAPLSKESTFHRTLFVFMCTSMACLLRDQHEQWKRYPETPSRSVKVFRCQLPRVNSFYSSESPTRDGTEQPLTAGVTLCNWCGTWKGDKVCSSCRSARYCSAKHQTAHWRASSNSSHKLSCRQLEASGDESKSAMSNSLWPEYEIIDDDEGELGEEISNDNQSSSSLISKSRTDGSFKGLMSYFKGLGDNRSWASFQERISMAPDQILRYSSSPQAKPLWPVSSGRPARLDIPNCNYCGGTRHFEFQVLPQLLYFFHVKDGEDTLDWASIVVYTCAESCDGVVGYKEEFAWIQLASQDLTNKSI